MSKCPPETKIVDFHIYFDDFKTQISAGDSERLTEIRRNFEYEVDICSNAFSKNFSPLAVSYVKLWTKLFSSTVPQKGSSHNMGLRYHAPIIAVYVTIVGHYY